MKTARGICLLFRFTESMESFPSSRERADAHRTSVLKWVQIPAKQKRKTIL